MKRVYESILILVLILCTIFLPSPVLADTDSFYYSSIDEINSLYAGGVTFGNVSFERISESEFALSMESINFSDKELECEVVIRHYDDSFNLIQSNTQTIIVSKDRNDSFYIKSKFDKYSSKYTTDDIKYYSVTVETVEKEDVPSVVGQEIPSKTGRYDSYEYLIDKYDMNIVVSESNVLDITETITAFFNTRKHGIYRKIPVVNNIKRNDGSKATIRAKISDLSVSERAVTSYENGYFNLKIGDENTLLTGEKQYVIKYKYDLGKDRNSGFDELYFNLIGTEWTDTVIGGVTFTITMPKDFNKNKLGFTHGKLGSTETGGILYSVDGKVITGNYHDILASSEGLTMRLELENEYFTGSGSITIFPYLMIVIPLAFLAVSFVLWAKYGKDDPVVETVEFYPPNGLNSLDLGFVYRGYAMNKDVVSLLIHLANRGYLKISEIETQKFITKKKSFMITKLREYDGNDVNERVFMNGLFTSKANYKSVNILKSKDVNTLVPDGSQPNLVSVTEDDLYDNFYRTMNRILSNVNGKENRYRYFEKQATRKGKLIIFLMVLSIFMVIAIPCFEYGGLTGIVQSIFGTIFLMGSLVFLIVPLPGFAKFIGFVLFSFGGMLNVALSTPWFMAIINEEIYLVAAIIGIASILGMSICYTVMPKRNKLGTELLGKTRGFKRFLETAKKEQLEALVMQNPTYFYDILPYTYVLGVSDKWIKKFESISMVAPNWYDGGGPFDAVRFGSFMNSTMSSATSSMSSSASDSSGGGSSGGGSGGGGGGSW